MTTEHRTKAADSSRRGWSMNGTAQWQKDTTFTTQWNYKQEIRLVEGTTPLPTIYQPVNCSIGVHKLSEA